MLTIYCPLCSLLAGLPNPDKLLHPAYRNSAGFARLENLAQILSRAGERNLNAETN